MSLDGLFELLVRALHLAKHSREALSLRANLISVARAVGAALALPARTQLEQSRSQQIRTVHDQSAWRPLLRTTTATCVPLLSPHLDLGT